MPEDFKNLNTARIIAGDFSQEPKGPSAHVASDAGFAGSLLIACGDRAAYSLSTGWLTNIARHAANEQFTVIRQDARDPVPVAGAMDVLLNPACPASPPKYRIDLVHSLKTSALGATNLLAKFKRALIALSDGLLRTIAWFETETGRVGHSQVSRQKGCAL